MQLAGVDTGGNDVFTSYYDVRAEILVFNRVLNEEDDLNNAGWYLQQKYGINGAFEYRAPRGTLLQLR